MCMVGNVHPHTGEHVRKAIELLTNAPWLRRLGVICDGTHKHTVLEGKYTTWSAVYPWEWCLAYARALKQAKHLLKLMQPERPMSRPDEYRVIMSTRAVTSQWPDVPLTFLRGSLREQAHETRSSVGQGKRSRHDLEKTAYDEEFYALADWLTKQKVPAERVHCSTRSDGTENWIVHVSRPVVDIREGKEKLSLNFQAYGADHLLSMGTEKAASLV